MNYYIQGDAANADKIKAAFEKLGYDVSGFNMCNDNILFFTYKLEGGGNVISTANANLYTAHIIKTHPDYKELELPVEPKFKVGDWLAANEPNNYARFVHVEGIEDSLYLISRIGGAFGGVDRPCITFVEEYYHPFSIQDAKDGDVLCTKSGKCPFIYRKTDYNSNLAYYYAGVDGDGDFCEGCLKRTLYHFGSVENVVPATKEQRDLLFDKMKEAGYEWDADKKELRKIIKPKFKVGDEIVWTEPKGSMPGEPFKIFQLIDKDKLYMVDMPNGVGYVPYDMQDCYKLVQPKPHYDISNFKPFDKVLGRISGINEWRADYFSHLHKNSKIFAGIGHSWFQCIPYEGNEHLLGTTDMPSEEFINW